MNLKTKKEAVMNEYWQIVEHGENINFIRELIELCRLQSNLSSTSTRYDIYEEEGAEHKVLKELEEEEELESLEYYSAFNSFVRKFENESSRVHSAMGAKTSELKKKTSAENGKKGGRPRKSPVIQA